MLKIKSTEWNLNFFNPKEFPKKREEWKKTTDNFAKKWRNNKKYLEDPKTLQQAIEEYEAWAENFGGAADEFFYYHLLHHINQSDPKISANLNKVTEFAIKLANEIQFFTINISKIKDQEKFLKYKGLQKYKHFLESLFKVGKYVLSEKEERIINLKEQSSYQAWVDMTFKFLAEEEREVINEEGKKVNLTFDAIGALFTSKNKKIRDKAAEAINDIISNNINVAESEINAILNNKKVTDDLRGYTRPDQARHVSDDIETEIVDTLIQTVTSSFDIPKEFYKLKAKLLKLKKLEYHERAIQYGNIDKKYSYEDSIKLVHKVYSNLDKKFAEILEMMVNKEQIDVFPKKGKIGGAWCLPSLKSQPTYVILNHKNKLRDVLTIAHELGHTTHHELTKEAQNAINASEPISSAEVASTFMEDFVLQELLKEADDETKLALLVFKLDEDIAAIQRQVACYNFEKDLHNEFREKGYLSKEEIGKIFQKNMSAYMGEYVENSKGSENWWVPWIHIRDFFYVYSYASGLLISKALQRMVKEDPKNIEKVKEFLSTGTSLSTKETFKRIGIDITKKEFWESGIQEVRDLLKETEILAKKLKKI